MQELLVLFADKDFLVVNKPSGVTVNRSDTTKAELTLQDMVESYLHLQPYYSKTKTVSGEIKSTEETFKERSGIVHRLDKETSGILLVAKTLAAFEKLQQEFKDRTVHKSYIALAHGQLTPQEGEISVPVGRLPFNRKRFGVVAGGRDSVTKYKVRTYYTMPKTKEILSLIDLFPETGRTHQIRVHLKHLNKPIVSDELYAGRKTARNDRRLLSRLFLHAAGITFMHPISGKEISFSSPLPKELQDFLNTLHEVTYL